MRTNRRRRVAVDRGISFEHLEARTLFSVPSGPDPWVIRGTPGDDEIVVSVDPDDNTRLIATVNGAVVDSRSIDDAPSLRIFGGRGDDTIRIDLPDDVTMPATIRGGWGDDQITGGPGDDLLGGGHGDDLLTGGGGTNTLRGFKGVDTFTDGPNNTLLDGPQHKLFQPNAQSLVIGIEPLPIVIDPIVPDPDPVLPLPPGTSLPEIVPIVLPDPEVVGPVIQPELPFDRRALLERLADAAVRYYQNRLGQKYTYLHWDYRYNDDFGVDDGYYLHTSVDSGSVTLAADGDFSGTNNQVDGVEEADRVQTDGQFIYLIDGTRLLIFDADPEQELQLVSALELGDYGVQIFLHDGILTTVSSSGGYYYSGGGINPVNGTFRRVSVGFGYNNWNYDPTVTVRQIDVSDPAEPQLLETTTLEGRLISTRQIDGRVYVVTTDGIDFPQPLWIQTPFETPIEEQVEENYGYWSRTAIGGVNWQCESAEDYRARILEMDLSDLLPGASTITAEGVATETILIDDPEIFAPDINSYMSMMSVTMFEAGDGSAGADDVTTVLGRGGTVYADGDSLYVASYGGWNPQNGYGTLIQMFDLTEDGSDFAASGSVTGTLLNQFSMDEHEGTFRIATTNWSWPRSNQILTLQQQGDELVTVGALTGLAPSEQIKSVRFFGDTAYVVTFLTKDPLFVIDLSDPTAPTVAGELHIPGYSSYLHPIGEGLIIGVGRSDVNEDGFVDGMKLSLFDVSDPANPVELHQQVFETSGWRGWGTQSAAEFDHHAFSYFPEQGILALPVDTGSWWYGTDTSSVRVIQVSAEEGFTQIGRVEHETKALRSLRIGGVLYTLSQSQLVASNLSNPATEYARLQLHEPVKPIVYHPVFVE